MNTVTTLHRLGVGIAAFCGSSPNLWAAEAPQEDGSGWFVWIFFAFCALIVVAQLIPAMMVLLGFAKGVKKEKTPATPEPIDDPTSPRG